MKEERRRMKVKSVQVKWTELEYRTGGGGRGRGGGGRRDFVRRRRIKRGKSKKRGWWME